jgi:signal transduction histidine kinase
LSTAQVLPRHSQTELVRSSDLLTLMHDIHQPLTVVHWLLSMVEHTAELPEVVVKRIELATREVDFLFSVLQDAMTADIEPSAADDPSEPLSAAQAAPATVAEDLMEQTLPAAQAVPVVVDLEKVVRSIVTPLTEVRPGAVDLQLSENLLVVIVELAFHRVLNNLIHNALRAGGETGRLRVRVENDGSQALLSVEDDGPGFGRIGRGRNLGLVSAATLVIAAGGSLELGHSVLGGVRVSVRLPALQHGDERT